MWEETTESKRKEDLLKETFGYEKELKKRDKMDGDITKSDDAKCKTQDKKASQITKPGAENDGVQKT